MLNEQGWIGSHPMTSMKRMDNNAVIMTPTYVLTPDALMCLV